MRSLSKILALLCCLWLGAAPLANATVSTTTSSVTAQGNGVTTAFSYNFIIPSASDVQVVVTNTNVNPATVTTLLPTQYTTTGINNKSGGIVTYPLTGSPLASGYLITISRVVPLIQTTSLCSQGPTFCAIESALDYVTYITQQLNQGIITFGTSTFNGNNTFNGTNAFNGTTSFSGTTTLSSTTTATGDVYLGSGRPWVDVRAVGAKGDGVTDDTAAIQSAITKAQSFAGGIVFFPPGIYCTFTGVSETGAYGGVIFLFSSQVGTQLSTCKHDVTALRINGPHDMVMNGVILGKGVNGDTGTLGASSATLLVDTSCIACVVQDMVVYGGKYGIWNKSGEAYYQRVEVQLTYGALLYSTGGGWYNRMKLDALWLYGLPSNGTALSAWQSGHTYSAGAVVSLGGYYLQTQSGGVSGGSSPTVANYGINIVDNTVTWQIIGPTTYYAFQMDTGAMENYGTQIDASGPFTAGIAMTNTGAGTAPGYFRCEQCLASAGIQGGMQFTGGAHHIYVTDSFTGSCVQSGCAGYNFGAGWGGEAAVQSGFSSGMPYGVVVTGGSNISISNVDVSSSTSDGILVTDTKSVNLIGNHADSSAGGYSVGGTADYFNVTDNACNGASTCVSNTASGTHYTISGNN